MVGKLVKNGMKDSSQAYLPVFTLIGISTLLALLNIWTIDEVSLKFISGIINMVLFGLIVAIAVISYRASIYVLYTSIYKKNSYRLFTLPVKSWEIIVSKILVSLIWSTLVGIATMISLFVIVSVVGTDFNIIWELIKNTLEGFKIIFSNPAGLVLMLDLFVRMFLGSILILFAGSVANSSWVGKNRGITTFVIFLLTLVMISKVSAVFGADMGNYLITFDIPSVIQGTETIDVVPMIWILLYDVLIVIFLGLGTAWMWDNKLEIIQ